MIDYGKAAREVGDRAKAVNGLRDVGFPLDGIDVLADITAGDEAARIDRIERGVGAIGRARHVRHVSDELGIGEL